MLDFTTLKQFSDNYQDTNVWLSKVMRERLFKNEHHALHYYFNLKNNNFYLIERYLKEIFLNHEKYNLDSINDYSINIMNYTENDFNISDQYIYPIVFKYPSLLNFIGINISQLINLHDNSEPKRTDIMFNITKDFIRIQLIEDKESMLNEIVYMYNEFYNSNRFDFSEIYIYSIFKEFLTYIYNNSSVSTQLKYNIENLKPIDDRLRLSIDTYKKIRQNELLTSSLLNNLNNKKKEKFFNLLNNKTPYITNLLK